MEAMGHQQVRLRFVWPGLEPEIVSLRLLPGLPRILRLMPGHPFINQASLWNPSRCVLPCKGMRLISTHDLQGGDDCEC